MTAAVVDARAGRATLAGWALALTATSTMAVSYVDRQTLAVLAPTVKTALGFGDRELGLLHASFALAYLVAAPTAGYFIDRVGARRGLLAAVLTWTTVAAAHALVPGLAALFALRIALGLAESPSFPGAAQTVQRALPPADRATGFGVLFSGSSVGAMIAPPVATYLVTRYDFRVAFLGSAVVGLAWVPLWLLVAFTRAGKARIDAPAVTDVESPVPRGAAAFREPGEVRAAAAALTPLALARTPAVLRLWFVVLASAPYLTLVLSWSATFLVTDLGLKQKDLGGYLVLPPLVFDLGSVTFGLLASRATRATGRGTVPRGLIGAAGALLCVGAAMPLATTPMQAMAVASVAMAGGAGLYGLGMVDAMARVPKGAVATVGGLGASAQSIAQIVTNLFVGWTVAATGHYTVVFVALGLWVIPGVVAWILWQP